MQKITVNTRLRMDRQKAGMHQICIRVIASRKKITEISLHHYIKPGDLQPNGSVRTGAFNSWLINQDIQDKLDEINKIILFHRLHSFILTKETFDNVYRKKVDTSTLHAYIRAQALQMDTCKKRLQHYNALAKHIETHFPKTSLAELNYNFLVKAERVFRRDLSMKKNTVTQKMSMLKAIAGHAFRQKLIPENPFTNYEISGYESTREYLTKDELLRIEGFYTLPGNTKQKNVAANFLFLCYTGMRIGDFEKLRFTDIKNGSIDYVQEKTGARCFVPISEPAARFIGPTKFNFRKFTGQSINPLLKIIATKCGITKPLSCHVARHTFAMLCLELGIDIYAISKMLGHTKIATTMIYLKMMETKQKSEMQKFSGFLDFKGMGNLLQLAGEN